MRINIRERDVLMYELTEARNGSPALTKHHAVRTCGTVSAASCILGIGTVRGERSDTRSGRFFIGEQVRYT